jgi:hypothetical protein
MAAPVQENMNGSLYECLLHMLMKEMFSTILRASKIGHIVGSYAQQLCQDFIVRMPEYHPLH